MTLNKNKKVQHGIVVATSGLIGAGVGIGISFIPKIQALSTGVSTGIAVALALVLCFTFALISYLVIRAFVAKNQEKKSMKKTHYVMAKKSGLVPEESVEVLSEVQKEINRKAYARRQYDKATKYKD